MERYDTERKEVSKGDSRETARYENKADSDAQLNYTRFSSLTYRRCTAAAFANWHGSKAVALAVGRP